MIQGPMRHALLLLAVLATLAACSHKAANPGGPRPSARDASGEQVPGMPDGGYQPPEPPRKPAEARNVPRADLSTPDAAYVPITSGAQLMFLYQAFSGLPVDADKTATEYSREYASTGDAFRRHDLLEALKPRLEALRAEARAHPYIRWDQEWTHVDHYDFDRKGFALKDPMLQEGGYGYLVDVRGYNLAFTNGEALAFAPAANEAQARELEALLQKNNLPIRFYAFVQSTDDRGEHVVRAHLTKVQVLDRAGHVVLESRASE